MAYSPSRSQFGRSIASNFASSRMNNSQPFNTSQLPPPQLPFQFSAYPSPHNFGTSGPNFQQGIGFSASRIPVEVAASFCQGPPNVYYDQEYRPDPTLYGSLTRSYDGYKVYKLHKVIIKRISPRY